MSRPAAAVCFSVVAGALCDFATQLKFLCRYDDGLDVSDRSEKVELKLSPLLLQIFASHDIGGITSNTDDDRHRPFV